MKFNLIAIIGLVMLVVGILFLLGVGIPSQETLEMGPVSASVETERSVHPAISGALVALGLVALIASQRQS